MSLTRIIADFAVGAIMGATARVGNPHRHLREQIALAAALSSGDELERIEHRTGKTREQVLGYVRNVEFVGDIAAITFGPFAYDMVSAFTEAPSHTPAAMLGSFAGYGIATLGKTRKEKEDLKTATRLTQNPADYNQILSIPQIHEFESMYTRAVIRTAEHTPRLDAIVAEVEESSFAGTVYEKPVVNAQAYRMVTRGTFEVAAFQLLLGQAEGGTIVGTDRGPSVVVYSREGDEIVTRNAYWPETKLEFAGPEFDFENKKLSVPELREIERKPADSFHLDGIIDDTYVATSSSQPLPKAILQTRLNQSYGHEMILGLIAAAFEKIASQDEEP